MDKGSAHRQSGFGVRRADDGCGAGHGAGRGVGHAATHETSHESSHESGHESIHLLSILTLAPSATREDALRCVDELDNDDWLALSEVASPHHVILRAFKAGETAAAPARRAAALEAEHERCERAAARLHEVCTALEADGCPVVVIKSFDHWPDLGDDLDLLTLADQARVTEVMRERFGAEVERQAWSDRVARKLNFRVPDLPEFVEIHFGRLGQAGEQLQLPERIMSRRMMREFAGRNFPVPAPEDRVLLATLQRLYRHFYIRICDFADTAQLLDSGELDFDELRQAAKRAAIWPGVATFLRLVAEYAGHYRGTPLTLPRRVELAACFGIEKVYPNAGFLRLPLFPQGAGLYLRQLKKTLRRRDTKAGLRLGLIPPLAMAVDCATSLRATNTESGESKLWR